MSSRPSLQGCEGELKSYAAQALERIISKPKQFEFNPREIEKFRLLRDYLSNEGIIGDARSRNLLPRRNHQVKKWKPGSRLQKEKNQAKELA